MKVKAVYLLAALVVLAVVVAGCLQQSKPEVKEVATPTPESTEKVEEAKDEESEEGHEEAVIVNEGEAAVTVVLRNYEFNPANIEVEKGQIVEFKIEEGTHTVTIAEAGHDEPLIDEEVSQGDTLLVKFNEAGSYDLVCKNHKDQMFGKIVVT